MLSGEDSPDDIIKSVKHGVYAVNFGGGQVDITNGKLSSPPASLHVEDGIVTAPLKNSTLIGNGPTF